VLSLQIWTHGGLSLVRVDGPLGERSDVDTLGDSLGLVAGASVIIDLRAVPFITDACAGALTVRLARTAACDGIVVVACDDEVRLALSDKRRRSVEVVDGLDAAADLLRSTEDLEAIVRSAGRRESTNQVMRWEDLAAR
jgi:hypothetical protein